MKELEQDDARLSLCGLNCSICPAMLEGQCSGCSGKENMGCRFIRCAGEHGVRDFCFRCAEYPCEQYDTLDEPEEFAARGIQKANLERAGRIGTEAYHKEQKEKTKILHFLLSQFGDGRNDQLFCAAVNMLDLQELQELLTDIVHSPELHSSSAGDKGRLAARKTRELAERKGISLSLHRRRRGGLRRARGGRNYEQRHFRTL